MAYVQHTARWLPGKVVNNEDLTQFPEKYRHVIAEKAGVLSRRHVEDECTSDVGARAVNILLAKSGLSPEAIDVLICATSSPDRMQPATATRVQELCQLKNAYAFDINSVCSGAVFAMKVANGLITDGAHNVIVVAAEVYSKILNPKELTTYPYFGDGAGAVLMTKKRAGYEVVDFVLGSDGSGADIIQVPAGGTMCPASLTENPQEFYFKMIGRKVYDFACDKGTDLVETLRRRNKITPDLVIPHQANINIIREIARRTDIPAEQFFTNLDKYANTAGASVLIALDEYRDGTAMAERLFLVVFGGGLSWAGCYLRKLD